MKLVATQTWSGTTHGAKTEFYVTPNGTTSLAITLTLDQDKSATFAGLVVTPASTTTVAGLRLPHGAAPTSPVNGDMWTTTAGLFVRINGATVGPLT